MSNLRKTFTIRVTEDNKGIGIYAAEYDGIVPIMPLVIGKDRFSLRSNIPAIRDHVKQMMTKEGFTRVICMDSDLIIYRELIADLEYIKGLDVIRL